MNVQAHTTPPLLTWLRRERAAGTPLGAICSAAYVLAKAGLLDNMETALHWAWHDLFTEEFPDVRPGAQRLSWRARRSSPPRAARRRRT
jgi:transcriptional regulator GlxA family with amidase domain